MRKGFPFFSFVCKFRIKTFIFASQKMVIVAQSVRALDCGSRGRRFESGLSPKNSLINFELVSFLFLAAITQHFLCSVFVKPYYFSVRISLPSQG